MKKILSKIFACLAVCMFAFGAVSLVACGEKENPAPPAPTHQITFAAATNLKVKDTSAQDKKAEVNVKATKWVSDDVTTAEKEAGVKAAYRLTSTEIGKVDEATKGFFGQQNYEICIAWDLDGKDATKLTTGSAYDVSGISGIKMEAETILAYSDEEYTNVVTDKYYWFVYVEDNGESTSEAKLSKEKTIYIAIDWDGTEGSGEKEVYKFYIPANVILGEAEHVNSAQKLKDAINGEKGAIVLDEDIELTNEKFTIGEGKDIILELNGKNITNKITDETRRDLFVIAGGKLTVNDANNEGSITLNGNKDNLDNGYVFNVGTHKKDDNTSVKGTLVINGGKFITRNDVTVVQLVFGEVTINNGSFQVAYDEGNGNVGDGSTLMINRMNKDKYHAEVDYYSNVKLVINGGKFEGFNPNGDRANKEDETDADKNYLGEDKEAVAGTGAESGWYIVQDKTTED